MASRITFNDKVQSQSLPNPANEKARAEDYNEIKTVVNAHATDIETNATDISTNTSNIQTNATDI